MNLPENFILIGADNSRYSTGLGIVAVNNYDNDKLTYDLKLLDYGYINTKKLSFPQALIKVNDTFSEILSQYKPFYISAEAPFSGNNAQTLITLSHIHGVMLYQAALYDIPVRYYPVMTMKSSVTGGIKTKKEDGTKKTGDEMKAEVAEVVFDTFGRNNFSVKAHNNDVTDALSAVLTFLNKQGEPNEKNKTKRKPKNNKTKE